MVASSYAVVVTVSGTALAAVGAVGEAGDRVGGRTSRTGSPSSSSSLATESARSAGLLLRRVLGGRDLAGVRCLARTASISSRRETASRTCSAVGARGVHLRLGDLLHLDAELAQRVLQRCLEVVGPSWRGTPTGRARRSAGARCGRPTRRARRPAPCGTGRSRPRSGGGAPARRGAAASATKWGVMNSRRLPGGWARSGRRRTRRSPGCPRPRGVRRRPPPASPSRPDRPAPAVLVPCAQG